MSKLVDKINEPLKLRHKRKKTLPSVVQAIQLIRQNKYDPTNFRHVNVIKVAIRHGYIDEELNIIKEVT